MKLQHRGSGSRASSIRPLFGALALIAAVGSAGIGVSAPALAARRHHHFDSFRFSAHRRPAGTHSQRVQAIAARQAKMATQDKALHSGNVVAAATAFQGTRYVFGGTSRSGFDCSGFVRYILGQSAGVSLPRTAMEQYLHGASVPEEQLKPGDLVFFKNTYRRGISHVGIYIGDGHFVHASNETRGVTVNTLNEAYYANHYAGARRVLSKAYAQATDPAPLSRAGDGGR